MGRGSLMANPTAAELTDLTWAHNGCCTMITTKMALSPLLAGTGFCEFLVEIHTAKMVL